MDTTTPLPWIDAAENPLVTIDTPPGLTTPGLFTINIEGPFLAAISCEDFPSSPQYVAAELDDHLDLVYHDTGAYVGASWSEVKKYIVLPNDHKWP